MTCLGNRKAQSMIELSFVALAVIAGILLGGPYLLDSINSHFKLWDTAVSDSNNDRLVKANKGDLQIAGGNCTFQSKAPAAQCGSERCNYDGTTRDYTWQYSPVGCQTRFTCEPDRACCTEPVRKNLCWRRGDPNNATRTWAAPDLLPSSVTSAGFHSCSPGGTNCQNGDELWTFSCGDLKNTYIALPNPNACMPKCNWGNVPSHATRCPAPQGDGRYMDNDKDNPDLIPFSQPCSTSPGACEAKCDDGTIPKNGQCVYQVCGDGEKNRPQEQCDGGQLCRSDCTCAIGSIPDGVNGCVCADPAQTPGYGYEACPGRLCGKSPAAILAAGCADMRYGCEQCPNAYVHSNNGYCMSNVREEECAGNSSAKKTWYWCYRWELGCFTLDPFIACAFYGRGCPPQCTDCTIRD